jgi:hypothetical protein
MRKIRGGAIQEAWRIGQRVGSKLGTRINAARPAATKEMLKPDLPKRLAALRLSAWICGSNIWLRGSSLSVRTNFPGHSNIGSRKVCPHFAARGKLHAVVIKMGSL